MSVETKVRLLGKVSIEEIVEYIKTHFDKNVDYCNINKQIYDWEDEEFVKEKYDKEIYSINGFISFEYKNEWRSMFYCYNSYNAYENLGYYIEYGLENMVKTETTYLSLGMNDNAIEILKEIVSYFGGWIDLDDCDEEPYYYVKGDKTKVDMPPIIHVTKEEVNKKFGGIVIIDD